MTLKEKQHLFARLVPLLMQYMFACGYEVTVGNTTAPTNHPHSVHPLKLAEDLNLHLPKSPEHPKGKYLRATKDHEKFGVFWEGLHELCRWGGRFSKPDGNHYSLEHGGHK